MIDLSGMHVVVTGGSRGIGAATSRAFAAAGAAVTIGFRSRIPDAERLVQELGAAGARVQAIGGDHASREGCAALFDSAERGIGPVTCFVGNAGVWPSADVPVSALDDERWARTMRENVDGMFYGAREAARRLPSGGRIVLVASTAGQRGEAGHADYAASKGAMISFVKSLAVELAPRDITVNSVAPGWVDTEMCAEPFANGGLARISAGIPLGRVAAPEDIAGPIVFLASRLARHVTGEILNVNGGSVLCG
ncbi:MAG: SDR family oxidoreductase [Gemmatimonadaceae bacterium]|jgi:3-oxoacyl-[acyl-carrier protein] reductase|nr:SDR family oxidoreductase [Gemmatimonadaceae bacterium]